MRASIAVEVTSIRLNSNLPPVQKVQILSFPTPFRTSQYLIFSPTQRTLKAHRKMSKNLQEISRWAGILLSIKYPPLNSICWKVTLFVVRYTFHALEKAHCYKMPLENQQFLKFLLFMISLHFVRKSTQKKKMQQNEQKFKGLENFKKCRFRVAENWGASPLSFLQLWITWRGTLR